MSGLPSVLSVSVQRLNLGFKLRIISTQALMYDWLRHGIPKQPAKLWVRGSIEFESHP